MAVGGSRCQFLIEYSMHRLYIGMAHIELMDRPPVGALLSMTAMDWSGRVGTGEQIEIRSLFTV